MPNLLRPNEDQLTVTEFAQLKPWQAQLVQWASKNRLPLSMCGVGGVAFFWYLSFPRFAFFGDDLMTLWQAKYAGYASSLGESLIDTKWGKYRPILNVLLGIEMRVFGLNHAAYEVFDMLIEAACAGLVTMLAWRLSGRNLVIAVCAGLMFAFNRFAYFNISQMLGPLESLSLLFFLLSLSFAGTMSSSRVTRPLVIANVFFFLTIFTDERYIVDAPFLALLPFVMTRRFNSQSVWLIGVLPMAIVLLNYFIKVAGFHMLFLEGTSGQALGFSPFRIASLFFAGIANLLGFNVGPDYLVGLDIGETGGIGYILGFIYLAFVLGTLYFAFKSGTDRRRKAFLLAFVSIFLLSPFVLSAAITATLHTRWLTVGYCVLILMLSFMLGGIYSTRGKAVFAVGLCAASILISVYYRNGYGNTYLAESNSQMQSALSQIVYNHRPGIRRAVIIDAGNAGAAWIMSYGHVLDIFGDPNYPVSMVFATSIADAKEQAGDAFFEATPTELIAQSVNPIAQPAAPAAKSVFDFISSFSSTTLSDKRHVDTPTGKGVLTLNLPVDGGIKKSLVILCDFSYRYPAVRVSPKEFMHLRAADPFPTGAGVRAVVNASVGGKTKTIFTRDFAPYGSSSQPIWESFDIPLDAFVGKSVVFSIVAQPSSGDQTASWLALSDAELAKSKR